MNSQRRWQAEKIKQGLCKTCGHKPIFKANLCVECRDKSLDYLKKYRKKHKAKLKKQMSEWRKNNKDYFKRYYLKLKGITK